MVVKLKYNEVKIIWSKEVEKRVKVNNRKKVVLE